MDIIFKPFCSQISSLKFLSDINDVQQNFLVGTSLELNNTLTLMLYDPSSDICDEPKVLSCVRHSGDVMDIQHNINHQRILTSGSDGSLNIYKYNDINVIDLDVGWDKVCVAPISGCIFNDDRIIAVSEDGEIVGLRLDANVSKAVRGFEFSMKDCAGVNAVEEIDAHRFITCNSLGQLKCWDIRTSTKRPTWSNYRSGEMISNHCLARHPGQPNIIASGSTSSVYIWDMRTTELGVPVQLNTCVENNDIWKMRFHPTDPNHLFLAASSAGLIDISSEERSFNWGDTNGAFDKLSMRSIVGSTSVNMTCLDVSGSLVVAATDREMLCMVPLRLM